MKLPNVLEKRNKIYSNTMLEEQLVELAQVYENKEYLNDAVDCLRKTKNAENLKSLKEKSIELGDFFLAKKIHDIFSFSTEEWEKLAKNALDKGKIFFAKNVYSLLENSEKEQELRQKIKDSYQGKYFERL